MTIFALPDDGPYEFYLDWNGRPFAIGPNSSVVRLYSDFDDPVVEARRRAIAGGTYADRP